MAALYQRYVPPTASNDVRHTTQLVAHDASQFPEENGQKKRKRERSDEQKAERKAKKLRKRGETTSTEDSSDPILKETTKADLQNDAEITGDFSRIKSSKKRHKLEKEARKARRVAERAIKVHASQDVPLHELPSAASAEPLDLDEAHDKGANMTDQENQTSHKITSLELSAPSTQSTHDASDKPEQKLPKKRRHELETVLAQDRQVVSGDKIGTDDHLRKHAAVLGKFQKSRQIGQQTTPDDSKAATISPPPPKPELRQLEPFPQPDIEDTSGDAVSFPALLPWLANPVVVSSNESVPMAELQLPPETLKQLLDIGFANALPVQQAVVPLLLEVGSPGSSFGPGVEDIVPDLAISAPTGSGKTLAYLLPMVEAIKKSYTMRGRLRALVVVPTRELASQVTHVAEDLVKENNLKIGIASGAGNFKEEQQRLVHHGWKYDPQQYRATMSKLHRLNFPPGEASADFEDYLLEAQSQTAHDRKRLADTVGGLRDHIPTYEPAIDILVCTPGRLVEHLNSTLGFHLGHISWLVLDEADKLLDEQYNSFLERLHVELSYEKSVDQQNAREQYLRERSLWDETRERRVRKVVLSATMTRDISKLSALRLQRPKLVVVSGADQAQQGNGPIDNESAPGASNDSLRATFDLPRLLREFSVPVGDGSEKPLHLVHIIDSRILGPIKATHAGTAIRQTAKETDDADHSSDDVDTRSNTSSSDSSSEYSSATEAEYESSADNDEPSVHGGATAFAGTSKLRVAQETSAKEAEDAAPTILVFTSSNEAAARLSHLLRNLRPELSSNIITLTNTSAVSNLSTRIPSSEVIIVISTDRAGRGLDTLSNRQITHVLQYDVPRSLVSYVHRVGRTARAGRAGEAWTMYTNSEARWFIKDVTKAEDVRRTTAVEKVKIDVDDADLKERYTKALAEMRETVFNRDSNRER